MRNMHHQRYLLTPLLLFTFYYLLYVLDCFDFITLCKSVSVPICFVLFVIFVYCLSFLSFYVIFD